MPPQCLSADISTVHSFACPSHGWETIQNFIYTTVHSLETKYLDSTGELSGPAWVEVDGQSSQRRLSISNDAQNSEGYAPYQLLATTQQLVIADALSETGSLWTFAVSNVSRDGHGSVLQRQDAVHAINSGYYQPYTAASCAADVIHGPHDDRAVAFPIPPIVDPDVMLQQSEYNDSILGTHSFVYTGLTRDQILSTPGSIEESRLKWVELPQDPFNGSAIGAVILLPRSFPNSTQELIVCNLGAGWGSSLLNTSTFNSGTAFITSVVDPSVLQPDAVYGEFGGAPVPAERNAADRTNYYALPIFPGKPVIVTEDWANYLNPFVSALNATVIDTLMSTNLPTAQLPTLDQIATANWALIGLLTNGLASIGASAKLQGDIKTVVKPDGSREWDGDYWFSGKGDMFIVDPEESKDWVKFRVDSTIEGYAYNIRGTSPKVAIAFLLAYCIIALSHVLYAGISGKFSLSLPSIEAHQLTT